MRRRDRRGALVGQQQRHAIGHLDGNRHIRPIADDDVCLGAVVSMRIGVGATDHDDVGAMHLCQTKERVRRDANRLRDGGPAVALPCLVERDLPGGEQMIRNASQRPALKRPPQGACIQTNESTGWGVINVPSPMIPGNPR